MTLESPSASTALVRSAMQANRSRNTRPELALRSLLFRHGLRFRVNRRIDLGPIKVRPDMVFVRPRVCIFIDGCWWHRCPEHGETPKAHLEYWSAKFERNKQRDRAVNAALATNGWRVVRLWEHVPAPEAVSAVLNALRSE